MIFHNYNNDFKGNSNKEYIAVYSEKSIAAANSGIESIDGDFLKLDVSNGSIEAILGDDLDAKFRKESLISAINGDKAKVDLLKSEISTVNGDDLNAKI